MDLNNFFSEASIVMNCQSKSKKNVLELISEIASSVSATNKDMVFEKLYEREKLGTTAFGNGIAIPHARIDDLSEAKIIILKLETAIDFNSSDGEKVDLIVSLLAPNNKNEVHIKILSKIAEMLDDKIFREKIRNCSNKLEIKSVINSYQ
jgi:PTS system nitrogen regulatory IIA component|tara:strand:- start:2 stop:451 length:450 start_codon:yes stop_codon:yes gene_type:complete